VGSWRRDRSGKPHYYYFRAAPGDDPIEWGFSYNHAADGTIVKTHTMQPLDERGYPSIEPARFALEVRAGQFAQWGIKAGDHVELPAELLN